MTDIEQMEDLLAQTNSAIQKHTKVITPEELGQDYLVHISMDANLKDMIPRIGMRQGDKEDRTLPRICASATLLGAMCGYAAMERDFLDLAQGDKLATGDTYLGGMKIYEIPFQVALDPSAKLVYDAEHTDEYWLVTYSKETVSYRPVQAGRMFYRSMTFVPRKGKTPSAEGVLYIEVTKEQGLHLTREFVLSKGYWRVEGTTPQFLTMKYKDSTLLKQFKITQIDKAEFMSQKNAVAALLGHDDPIPSYMSW